VLGALALTADDYAFMVMELGSQRVWSINRGCLLLLGTWSHLWYIQRSVLAHLFLWFVIPTCILRLITLWYLSHFIESNGRLTTSLYDKRDDFNFTIVNFPFLCSSIPLSPVYGMYIS
jgi:hypothetical protein